MLKDLPSVLLKCSICFQWQLLYSHSLYNHVTQAQNGSNAAVSAPAALFTDYVIIWLLLIVPIRQGDGSRIAGLDLLHIKVINDIMLSKLNYKKVCFFLFVQTECKKTPKEKKNCLKTWCILVLHCMTWDSPDLTSFVQSSQMYFYPSVIPPTETFVLVFLNRWNVP